MLNICLKCNMLTIAQQVALKAQQHDYNILTTQPNGEALTATFLLKYALDMLLLCKYVAF